MTLLATLPGQFMAANKLPGTKANYFLIPANHAWIRPGPGLIYLGRRRGTINGHLTLISFRGIFNTSFQGGNQTPSLAQTSVH